MTIIIAEAGVNHNGDLSIAKQLVKVAKDAGADFVKFQTFKADQLVLRSASLADYQKNNLRSEKSQFEMLKDLELSDEAHRELWTFCADLGIKFLSTPFDERSLNFLLELGCKTIKIPSGELTNFFLLEAAAKVNFPTILSTGMASEVEIHEALACLVDNGLDRDNLMLLHCTTEYPCPYDDVNLSAITEMHRIFRLPIGYSDHTNGIDVAGAAVALGAAVIEKHFTLDRGMAGPDHLASIEPVELKAMVDLIRIMERCRGDGIKIAQKSESKNILIARKSLVAKHKIDKGEKFSRENVMAKRPANGINPMLFPQLIGKVAHRSFAQDEQIEIED